MRTPGGRGLARRAKAKCGTGNARLCNTGKTPSARPASDQEDRHAQLPLPTLLPQPALPRQTRRAGRGRRKAFCSAGCYSGFYRSHCLVCDRGLQPGPGNRKTCARATCRNDIGARPDLFGFFAAAQRVPLPQCQNRRATPKKVNEIKGNFAPRDRPSLDLGRGRRTDVFADRIQPGDAALDPETAARLKRANDPARIRRQTRGRKSRADLRTRHAAAQCRRRIQVSRCAATRRYLAAPGRSDPAGRSRDERQSRQFRSRDFAIQPGILANATAGRNSPSVGIQRRRINRQTSELQLDLFAESAP